MSEYKLAPSQHRVTFLEKNINFSRYEKFGYVSSHNCLSFFFFYMFRKQKGMCRLFFEKGTMIKKVFKKYKRLIASIIQGLE